MSPSDGRSPASNAGSAGRIVSLHRSDGGVPKPSVESAWVSVNGMEGDRQEDLVHHGGPDRALLFYSVELIERLRLEGHPISPGAAGENVTLQGVDWTLMRPGARLVLGDVRVELTSFASPCETIRNAFINGEFKRISEKLNPGWSRLCARVIAGDQIVVGQRVSVAAP